MEVTFLFKPDDNVESNLGDIGIVLLCAIDRHGIKQYYIKLLNGDEQWFDEDQVTAV